MSQSFFATPSWKKTALGTPIALHAVRALEELRSSQPILLLGGIHGDEPEGVELATKTLAWLQTQESSSVAPWICVPCLNVDGFAKRTRVNGRGVDLNRNYPARNWAPTAEKERYFPGAGPASEPEVQGVVELITTFKPRLVIHCHSWEPCIVGTGPRAKRDAERLSRSSGYKVVEDIGYPTPGALSSYGWHDLKVPVICIEEKDDLTDLQPIWPRFATGMREVFLDLSLRDGQA